MDEIISRLERIERRLDALEGRPSPAHARPDVGPRMGRPLPPPSPSAPVDLESLIGSRWLPRVGALFVVGAMAYLVALGVQSGRITPTMVVVAIGLVCLGAIALGLRLRQAREAYGHVLVGLGAGGLYVDAVGAHLYQGLLGAEAMVAACLAVSLASLAYGCWKALPSFLGIGLVGGLSAALMPLTRNDPTTTVGLFLLVVVPAFSVAAFRRWPMAVAGTWASSALAALLVLYADAPLTLRLLPMDAALLIAVAAWSLSVVEFPKDDPKGAFPLVAAAGSGLAVLGAWKEPLHLLFLGALLGAIGLVRRQEAGLRVAFAGLGLAATLAPLALRPPWPEAVLAALAVAAAVAPTKIKGLAFLSAVNVTLALLEYAMHGLDGVALAPGVETGLIVLLALAAAASAHALRLPEARIGAGLAAWGLATRLAFIVLDLPTSATITTAWIAVCAGLFAVGFWRRRPELRQLGLAVAGVTAAKVVLFDLSGLESAMKAALLFVLGLVLLGSGYAYVRAKGNLGA